MKSYPKVKMMQLIILSRVKIVPQTIADIHRIKRSPRCTRTTVLSSITEMQSGLQFVRERIEDESR